MEFILISILVLFIWVSNIKNIFITLLPLIFIIILFNRRLNSLEKKILELTEHIPSLKNNNLEVRKSPKENIQAQDSHAREQTLNTSTVQRIESYYNKDNEEKNDNSVKTIKSGNFEKQWGLRLPVWIGGISLALASFFMVKYSIENALLSPTVRTFLGAGFGIFLLYLGHFIRKKTNVSNSVKIAQALSGAGIADLYFCVYAATNFYDILPSFLGFLLMAVVTAIAVTLSLVHGYPIALLGMVGGFVTPLLFNTNTPNTPLLFIYLYIVLAGIFSVVRKQNWWFLSIPAIIFTFFWVIMWLCKGYNAEDSLSLGLFLIAISATVVISTNKKDAEQSVSLENIFKFPFILNYLTLFGSIILTATIALKSGFGLIEWGLLWLLAAGSMFLAYFNYNQYKIIPWLSFVTSLTMLLLWNNQDLKQIIVTISAFAVLFTGGSYLLLWRSPFPVLWASLSAISAIGYYLLAYYKISIVNHISFITDKEAFFKFIPGWGLLALSISLFAVSKIKKVMSIFSNNEELKQRLLAVFALTVTSFLSLGITIELDKEFLSLFFASAILAVSWINTKVNIKALRAISAILGCIFAIIILPQLLSLNLLLLTPKLYISNALPILKWPVIQLGLPAFMFLAGSILLRKEKDDKLVGYFELASIGLFSLMLFYLTRYFFHPNENLILAKLSLNERSMGTIVTLLFASICLHVYNKYKREAFLLGCQILNSLALIRLFFIHLLSQNPLLVPISVGDNFLFNSLLPAYLIPIIGLYLINRKLPFIRENFMLIKSNNIASILLLFTFISLTVRQYYHGEYLYKGGASNAEIYSYSFAWLIMGIALLKFGITKNNQNLRVASLIITL
jgi:uncharacterized membrane protein